MLNPFLHIKINQKIGIKELEIQLSV